MYSERERAPGWCTAVAPKCFSTETHFSNDTPSGLTYLLSIKKCFTYQLLKPVSPLSTKSWVDWYGG